MLRTKTILLCAFLVATPMSTWADDKEDVAKTMQAWADAMTAHDQDRVLALYAPDAVLWGTRSPTIRTSPEKLREYFGIL
ncbi:MAG: nuclear transport factor 2 family protein, partial [Bacillota bacterium]